MLDLIVSLDFPLAPISLSLILTLSLSVLLRWDGMEIDEHFSNPLHIDVRFMHSINFDGT